MMATVVDSPAQAVASSQLALVAVAVDVVQQDEARAVAEEGVAGSRDGVAAADLLAHHPGVAQAPVVVAHRAPAAPVVDLHTALARVQPTHQTERAVSCGHTQNDQVQNMNSDSYLMSQ